MATGVDRVVVGTAVVEDRSLLEWAIDRLGTRWSWASTPARAGSRPTAGPRSPTATRWTSPPSWSRWACAGWSYTDINRDGTLGGPNLAALRRLSEAAPPLKLIASGGISSLDDLRRLRDLGLANLDGVIVGRALYEGRFTVGEGLEALAMRSRA